MVDWVPSHGGHRHSGDWSSETDGVKVMVMCQFKLKRVQVIQVVRSNECMRRKINGKQS